MVLVINQDGSNGEPCSNTVARILIKDNKAIIQKYKPFTIRLTFNLDEVYNDATQPATNAVEEE